MIGHCHLQQFRSYQSKEYKYSQLTNYTEQSPSWEANSHSATPEIPHIVFSPKVHYSVHNNPLLNLILSQMNPVNIPSYFLKI
jgi:hypothetical protein